jgi:molybdopterin converting factor subunit 1
MYLSIKLFANLRELCGTDQVQVQVPTGSTLKEIIQQVAKEYPQISSALSTCLLALDCEYVDLLTQVHEETQQVAIIPLVGGG